VAVTRLATACGAAVTTMSAARHDELLARLSHVPQLVASALAAALTGLEPAESALGGSGIQDTTRIADSDPQLWASIIGGNAAAVARALHDVVSPLVDVMHRLASDRAAGDGAAAVSALVEQGRSGRARLAGKHGERAVRWATVSVVVPDEPGSLARLLADAGEAGVNVEDIRVDHAPGRALGLVELAVDPDAATRLRDALATARWTATVDLPTGARPPGA
jgi:prephenate dehydrogenase